MAVRTNFVVAVLVLFSANAANAAVTLLDKDQWKVMMNGFVELDGLFDSTRSFAEAPGNAPVQRPDNINGQTGRAQFSIRDSRLGFTVEAPQAGDWKTKGVLEFDLFGYDPAPGTPTGGGAAINSEGNFYNSPTIRVRHAYLSGENDGWQLTAGQTWGLIGFQPYYFIPSIEPVSVPGMLCSRTAQVRALKAMPVTDDMKFQAALAVMRPPQRDASLPGLEGGLRFIFNNRSAGFTNGAGGPEQTQPMSVAITGAAREFVIPLNTASPNGDETHLPATAIAVDALVPVLASSDGKDVGNTLMIGGEFTTGRGYGDSFLSWTGNTANPFASGASATTVEKNVNLDGGIGDFDPSGNFQLIDLRTFNAYFQYHLPSEWRTWISGGYGRIYSDNVALLTVGSTGKTGAGTIPYTKDQIYFANITHDLTKSVRVAFEFAHLRTDYADDVQAHNNRYQISAWFMF